MGRTPRRRSVAGGVVAAIGVVAVLVAGCTSSSTATTNATGQQPKPSGKVGALLTIASVVSPQTLDPGKTAQNYAYFEQLAYEPLIVGGSNGQLEPGLATSWTLSDQNKTLTFHLRNGVKFSDGTALTAQTVVDHFKYVVKSAGPFAAFLAGDTFTTAGPLTVAIHSSKPIPDLPTVLTQDDVIGGVISNTGLANPSKLGTQTFGAGPYMLDAAATVSGDHYTYVPNPNYYDKAAVHWKKVVIKIITNQQSVLNALKTGQVDFAAGDASTADAAKQAGLIVTSTPFTWHGVTLADRGGKLSKPLADVRVRQALNYATDRAAIANAIFPGNSQPTAQITVPGGYGYDSSLTNAYPYDVAKAKQLLTQAGYPHGFSLKLVTANFVSLNLEAQALKQQWAKIGVDLQVTDDADPNQYGSDAFGAKYPAFSTAFGQLPIGIEGPALFMPTATYNPFHTTDAHLQSLYDQDQAAAASARPGLDRQVVAYLVHQAWFVPIFTTGVSFYARSTITGTAVSAKEPLVSLYAIQPAG